MKDRTIMNIVYIILIGLLIFACNRTVKHEPNSSSSEAILTKSKVDSIYNLPRIKMVFIIANPNIDVNTMDIDEVTDKILSDSVLHIKQITSEFYIKPQIVKVYKVEDITCSYLKERFKKNKPGELVYEYNGRILIKLSDGVIKVYRREK